MRDDARHVLPRRERGFMLVEALVSLAIVAMMAGLVFETISQLGNTAARASQQREATLLARSILAAASVDTPSPAIPASGTDGDLAWSIANQPYPGEGGRALYKMTVTISRRADGRALTRLAGLKAGS